MTEPGSERARPRVVAIADTDSYVKWAAALLGSVAGRWDASLLVLETPLVVSEPQLGAALRGSGLDRAAVERVSYAGYAARLRELRADVVVIGARGPLVRVVAREVAATARRPVIVTGLPGISIPATRKAVVFRLQCDLFVLHSRRELREFGALSSRTGYAHQYALATLPFARGAVVAGASGHRGAETGGTDLVFAPQAKVPAERSDRLGVARMLVRAAAADPSRRVVVKLRAANGEQQTHVEQDGYPELLASLGPLPPNIVTSTGAMVDALSHAEGLVTVSSTAAIEAVARGIPVIALDTYGVSPQLINETLADADLLAPEADVVERRFRHPDPEWLDDNYFHDPAEDDWINRVEELVAGRAAGMLPARAPLRRAGGPLRDAWERKIALGRSDTSLAGAVALLIGVPLRALARLAQRVRSAVGPGSQQPGADESSAHVRSTSAVRTSTTRTP